MQCDRMAPSSPTVFLVDDDADALNSLIALMRVSALPAHAYASAESFLESFDPRQPGCLVLDMCLDGMSGIQLLDRLRAEGAEIPAIVVSGHANIAAAVQSMKLGAIEFLQKPVNPMTLLASIRLALRIDTARRAEQTESLEASDRMASLTNREYELLKYLARGLFNREIAAAMGISIKTVEHHRAHVMAKTRALNSADLVRLEMLARRFSGGMGRTPDAEEETPVGQLVRTAHYNHQERASASLPRSNGEP